MFETERLILRKLNKDDGENVFAMRSDAEIMRFIREPQIRRETDSWIELVSSRWQTEKIGLGAVIEKFSGKFIGWCGLWRLPETGETEVGYALDKKFWGKGFATEAAARYLKYGFEELNFDKIVAVARPENIASRRVMERLGMTLDGTGIYYERELVHYTIRKNEFLGTKK
jgi:RimJ/RimL family protein N-acetyltransferase